MFGKKNERERGREKKRRKKGCARTEKLFFFAIMDRCSNVKNVESTDVDFYTMKKQMSNQFRIHCIESIC